MITYYCEAISYINYPKYVYFTSLKMLFCFASFGHVETCVAVIKSGVFFACSFGGALFNVMIRFVLTYCPREIYKLYYENTKKEKER